MQDGVGVGYDGKAERADGETGGQIAEHGTETDSLENGNGNDTGRQNPDDWKKIKTMCRFTSHPVPRCIDCPATLSQTEACDKVLDSGVPVF